ncbi:MAG TPA: inositol oxygenase [Gammaproteobacteria bacterium]|nr:inositol oxygenase [Gammaproteobacteria bacterium]
MDNSGTDKGSGKTTYRNYVDAKERVRHFYELNHSSQTLDFARAKRADYMRLSRRRMGIWEACEYLDSLVDDSDPDTESSQIIHCLQTAEAIRADGHPDWFILTGLVHDLGKILCLFGEPQWAVTGDTFPLGCAFKDSIVYHQFFEDNDDTQVQEYQTPLGIYQEHCGLDNVTLSWGHDEYMYLVAREFLPEEALYMIRYHSFYPGHATDTYDALFDSQDRKMFSWVRQFNTYDLYTKHDQPPDVAALKSYYEDLSSRYFPDKLAW